MPAYDSALTPARGMGAIADFARSHPRAVRSDHPQVSFAAFGAQAEFVTRNHELAFALGDCSPLARVYDLDGWILLLGVGFDRNTSLHLAEHRTQFNGKRTITQGAPVASGGERVWTTFEDIALSTDDADALGAAFEDIGRVTIRTVGCATARFMSQRAFVDFASDWYTLHR